jgi:hypothetical protein
MFWIVTFVLLDRYIPVSTPVPSKWADREEHDLNPRKPAQ